MTTNNTRPDFPTRLFTPLPLGEGLRVGPALRNIFSRAVDERLRDCRLSFAGMFAKTDYLIKECGVDDALARQVNETRKRLFAKDLFQTPERRKELEEALPYDLKNVCLFISAINGGAPVPEELARLFPADDRPVGWGAFDEKVLRVTVNSWDATTIHVREEVNGSEIAVCYGAANKYLNRTGGSVWSYLGDIMWRGARLNLVRLRWVDDVCHPELIILEPDYLINITTIAGCFESYAESPAVGLINKLKPNASTRHTFLGNLAGRYLDETVQGISQSFAEGLNTFFRENALGFVTTPELAADTDKRAFCNDAMVQRQNIKRLIGDELPQHIEGYDRRDVVLEPSFFSEVLGLQGRLDFLHEHDGDVTIVEQKAGKGGFAPGMPPDTTVPQTKHHVQAVLYRALFTYDFDKYANQMRHLFLLYSKYARGLVAVQQAPDLLLRAIRLRNLLAHQGITSARVDGVGWLAGATPETLCEKSMNGKFWNDYVRPQLDKVLRPLREATPLERAYYCRMMRFVEMERLLAKMGNYNHDDRGFASLWTDTLEDKIAAGNIYHRLTIERLLTDGNNIGGVRLGFASDTDNNADTSNFRTGDIVILYPYRPDTVPDACAQMVFRASIESLRADGITLRLRDKQTHSRVFGRFEGHLWAVEHDFFESSFGTLTRGLHSLLSATVRRRDLLLAQRRPETDGTLRLNGNYGGFDDLVLRAMQARDLFIVIGPPGTGKTSFAMLNILKEQITVPRTNILLMAYTNRAVDEICSKLQEEGIGFVRMGSDLNCPERYHDSLFDNIVNSICRRADDVRRLIDTTRVVCGTTSAINKNIALLDIKHFDLAIIDEASQILEPQLTGLLAARYEDGDAIDRMVMIGDHKQLPAVVQQPETESAVGDEALRAIGLTDCRRSLFERLLSLARLPEGGYDPSRVYMLTRQGRMHRDIADFPNLAFYGGLLDTVPLPHQEETLPTTAHSGDPLTDILATRRVAFFNVTDPGPSPSDKVNVAEAELIADVVARIYRMEGDRFDTDRTVGVIVPYRNQIATVRQAIDRHGIPPLHDITIDTVERYQGSQRDHIVYGFTVRHPYQLDFLGGSTFIEDGTPIDRKLNVAMTRARRHLVMTGNATLLRENEVFARLIDYMRDRGGFFNADSLVRNH